MSILSGLIGTEQLSNQRFRHIRRAVFYNYPNGAAPLMGLLSLIDEDTPVYDPEFKWFEDRWPERKDSTAAWAGGSIGPFATDAGSALTTGDNTLTAGVVYRLQVGSTQWFRQGATIKIANVSNSAATANTADSFVGIVREVLNATQIRFTPVATYTNVSNTSAFNIGNEVLIIGSAYAEGAIGSAENPYQIPFQLGSNTQIFRTSFSFTGTELQTSLTFDKTGIYKDKAKKASLSHMIDLEWAALFGVQSKSVDPVSNLPTYTSPGVLSYLRAWEATNNNAYGSTGATLNSDDNKRIINIGGALSEAAYDDYLERLFRVTNNQANEKLCLCGNQFLNVLNKMYKGRATLTTDIPMAGIWGSDIIGHRTSFGTVYYKTHPLYNQNTNMRSNALFLDVNNIKYRPMKNRDTQILRNRQPNDADFRKDEYLTEAGFEVRFPESHMYMTGVSSYIP